MNESLLIVGMACLTFIPRYLPLCLAGRVKLSPVVERALSYVPIAVLAAIISQATFVRQSTVTLTPDNPYAIAAISAFIASLASKNLMLTILIGMTTFFLVN